MRRSPVIICLEKNMGVYENNKSSKKNLTEIVYLISNIDSPVNGKKYEELIKSPLRMLVDKIECIKCINDSIEANKQPFLITSGSMGVVIVYVRFIRNYLVIFTYFVVKR